MLVLLKSIIWSLFRRIVAGSAADAENVALRHQVRVLHSQLRRRPKLTRWDRLLFASLYHVHSDVLRSISIVRPETVVRWHRAGFGLFWKRRSRGRAGRPRVPTEVRKLIRRIGVENPLWGAPRIHGELLKLGIDVSQSTVATYMVRRRHPPSQSWLTFLRNHADGIAAIDVFVVPTIGYRLLFGFVVLDHGRRRILHVAATYHPTAEWLARQIVEAFPWETAPEYLIRDRDCAYGNVFRKRLSAMGIRDGPTAPRSPWQNGYVERVIGSIRRDLQRAEAVIIDETENQIPETAEQFSAQIPALHTLIAMGWEYVGPVSSFPLIRTGCWSDFSRRTVFWSLSSTSFFSTRSSVRLPDWQATKSRLDGMAELILGGAAPAACRLTSHLKRYRGGSNDDVS